MRTHGHREGSTTHWGLLGEVGEGQQGAGRSWEGIAFGKTPNVDNEMMDAAGHHGTCVPM